MLLLNKILPRIMLISIAMIIVYLVAVNSKKVKRRTKIGPSGMSFTDSINCSEFSKFGRFNPYSVLNEKWFVFYYWAPTRPQSTILFTHPTANLTKYLQRVLDGNCILPVMWSARLLVMEESTRHLSLLVERGDRGEYWLYPIVKVRKGERKITPRDIRMKQTGDNRLLGLMDCALETVLVMAKINDVPPRRHLQEVASRIGYRGRRGKSYLYQGHEWGPMPEAEEHLFWEYKSNKKSSTKSSKESQEESKDESKEENKEGSNEEEPTNTPEDSQEENKETKAVEKTLNEDEAQQNCVRLDPELWNDPKPEPENDPDYHYLTKDELTNLIDTDTSNTLTIEDNSQNNKLENDLEKQTENTLESNKLDSDQDTKMEIPLHEPRNLYSHTEKPASTNSQFEKEDCDVCFKSISTNDAYRSENSRTIKNYIPEVMRPEVQVSGEERPEVQHAEVPRVEVPRPEVTRTEVPRPEVQRAEVPRVEVPRPEVTRTEVPRPEVQRAEVPRPDVPRPEVTRTEVPRPEVQRAEVPRPDVPRPEVTRTEVPRPEVQRAEVPRVEVPRPEVTRTEVPRPEVQRAEVPRPEVQRAEVPRAEVPRSEAPRLEVPRPKVLRPEVQRPKVQRPEVPRPKVPRAAKSRAKESARSPVPKDLKNSSEIIIMSPRTIEDLES